MNQSEADVWLARLRLTFEFTITIVVLVGAFLIALTPGTATQADSGAAAVATLVVGYWFGRGRS
jgi:hypothetical protein